MLDPVPALVLRMALALLFALSAVQKLRAPAVFVEAVRDYRLVPSRLAAPFAATLIALELVLAGGTVAGVDAALVGLAVLLVIYSAAIAINLRRGRAGIDCGCGDPRASRPLSHWLVARNLGLAALAGIALLPVAQRELGWIDAISILAAIVVSTALYAAVELLAAMAPRLGALRHG